MVGPKTSEQDGNQVSFAFGFFLLLQIPYHQAYF